MEGERTTTARHGIKSIRIAIHVRIISSQAVFFPGACFCWLIIARLVERADADISAVQAPDQILARKTVCAAVVDVKKARSINHFR